jgi:hypothetical protein
MSIFNRLGESWLCFLPPPLPHDRSEFAGGQGLIADADAFMRTESSVSAALKGIDGESVFQAFRCGILGQKNLEAAADAYVEIIQQQGYRLPFKPGAKNDYPWGSNSFVLNNAIVLALAHDFTILQPSSQTES